MRYRFLDSLRGFALLGILLVNIVDLVGTAQDAAGRSALDLLVQSRFVPIFTLLFGASLYLIADGARRRGTAGWVPLVWRMAGLGVIGVLHSLVYDGDILRIYAAIGLFVIPLVVWLSPRWVLLIGVALTIASFTLGAGATDSTPGLMLVGAGAAGIGVPARLERSPRAGLWLAGVGILAAVPLLLAYSSIGGDPRYSVEGTRAGVAAAIVYIGVLAIAWHWRPARAALRAVFEPLGRMSLTNYVTASVIVVVLKAVGVLGPQTPLATVLAVAVAIIAAQSVGSRVWLSGLRYGPLEWVLRAVTWRSVPPLRRERPAGRDFDRGGSRMTTWS
ncbi:MULTISPECIES: DUF418 domain-containing protein [Tsukamurella]|uniref:DUF418 domain-containing protein n=1 Tax=Tsukamurella strandjordii TaxID=147577 RepID=A0AA90SFB4_9ACTN|nr:MULTISPECIES: DUF418 domain-containing protein [Tsukamurella]MDP0396429.1 DUF418 domain-containing protein [Tsukamurella strandjordii]GIZ96230.1 membrane protein [Tsukamurella sp. TY48]